ncbi:MFS transporter [Streptomyces bicolor]|uniref:MFS transporter n=1 Tax=Streptomyces bicolor TaxID=66874 RepID=UPI00068D49CF|nr:MFS transporter [Streptomyces bicolor]
MALSSWAAGAWLVPRYGARVMSAGLLALLAGAAAAAVVYATGRPGAYPWPLLPALAVAGLGQGLYAVPFFTTVLHHVRPHETGSAAGLLNAVQQLGGTLGVALLGSVFFHTAASGAHAHGSAALTGARNAFCVAAWLVLATAAATAFIGPRQQRSSTSVGPASGHASAAQQRSQG